MKVILDLVVNHTSNQHKWFEESKKSKDNLILIIISGRSKPDGSEPTNWESTFGRFSLGICF